MAENDKKISEFTAAIAADITDEAIIPVVVDDSGTLKNVKATLGQIKIDASPTRKGNIQLTGDLGGTASNPTVPGLLNKADLLSPIFTGEPVVPNVPSGDNSSKIANTKFVYEAVTGAIAGIDTSTPSIELTETISSHIEVPQDKVYTLETTIAYGYEVVSISIKSSSGTGNFWLTSNDTPLQGGVKNNTNYTGSFSTVMNTVNIAAVVITGNNLAIELAEVNQPLDLTFTIIVKRDI